MGWVMWGGGEQQAGFPVFWNGQAAGCSVGPVAKASLCSQCHGPSYFSEAKGRKGAMEIGLHSPIRASLLHVLGWLVWLSALALLSFTSCSHLAPTAH